MDHGGSVTRPAVRHSLGGGGVRSRKIRAVHGRDEEIWKTAHQLRNAAARSLALDRCRDGKAVVLDKDEQRKLLEAGEIQHLPKLAFRCSPIAGANQCYLIAARI